MRHTEVTEQVLRSALAQLLTEPMRAQAALLGERLRAGPDSTLVAADEIDKYLAAQPS